MISLKDKSFQGKFAKYKRYTGHSAHVTRVRWTHDDSYLISIGGRDIATLVWKHVRDREIDISTTTSTTLSKRSVTGVNASSTPVTRPLRKERGESDDSDNTDSEEEGYDSDVQHDRNMDYNARILIDPIRAGKKDVPRPTTTGNRRPV